MTTHQWYIIETKKEYDEAVARFEQIDEAQKGSIEHKEMLLLALLINNYEMKIWTVPEIDPIDMIKSRMEDMDLTAADLAKAYGDKGTVSKVLNYKQRLSLNMIRVFSKLLRISPTLLTKDYMLTKQTEKSSPKPKRIQVIKKRKTVGKQKVTA